MHQYGHPQQHGGVWRFRLDDGPGLGQRVWLLHGYGWQVQLLPDRGLDAAAASWRGHNLSWLSPSGLTDASAFDPRGLGWLRSFTGGLLTTCGPGWFGPPCRDGDEDLGLHGRFHVTPAQEVNSWSSKTAEGPAYHVSGIIRDAVLFGQALRIEREWRLDPTGLHVHDHIVNDGVVTSPLCLLYHCNLGAPLLSQHSHLELKSQHSEARDAHSASCTNRNVFHEPQANFQEQVWFHKPQVDDGRASAQLINPNTGLACQLDWNAASMPWMTQWRCLAPTAYVCGLEPGTAPVRSRCDLRERGELPTLAAGDARSCDLHFSCLSL